MSNAYPYAERFGVNRTLPETRPARARRSSPSCARWPPRRTRSGRPASAPGTMYCGDHEHYDFMNEAFGLFAHVNVAPARHVPERDAVRGRDHRHDARPAPRRRGHRHHAGRARHHRRHRQHPPRRARLPRARRPDPRHDPAELHQARDRRTPRSTRRATCSASSCARRRSTRARRRSTSTTSAAIIDDQTIAIVGSACNYGYGTIDPIDELAELALRARRRPARRRLPRRVHPPVRPGARLRHPALRLPGPRRHAASRPTPTSTATRSRARRCSFRDKALRNAQYFFLTDWTGGKYCSPGIEGSRSAACSPPTWASMVHLGREGYRGYAKEIFETADAMQDAVRSHPELRLIGDPTFLFSFTTDEFDIYHVNDFMRPTGLAVQRPAVPERAPHGGHPAADAAGRRRGVRHRPRRGGRRTPRRSTPPGRRVTARSTAASPAG